MVREEPRPVLVLAASRDFPGRRTWDGGKKSGREHAHERPHRSGVDESECTPTLCVRAQLARQKKYGEGLGKGDEGMNSKK
jgi:hypothetical protein